MHNFLIRVKGLSPFTLIFYQAGRAYYKGIIRMVCNALNTFVM